MKRIFQSIIIVAMLVMSVAGASAANPKHEFRGAWLHIIGQGQYAKQSTAENKAYLIKILDQLKASGCNAVIWQIRPQADAAYVSDIEPWSRWITGTAGKAPDPLWDPLQFMIDECHKRGMELHAWINPYRVTSGSSDKPAKGHVYYEHPEWFVKYADGKIYFDPGLPESRNFIDKVVRDILTRYDVDAIHMDDYFYPYPKDDVPFPDQKSFEKYGAGFTNKGDWRRHNVDLLIEQLHNTIHELKPWVQFGISPFGIWRNKKNDPDGSDTNGLQCYDALYADCPSWTAGRDREVHALLHLLLQPHDPGPDLLRSESGDLQRGGREIRETRPGAQDRAGGRDIPSPPTATACATRWPTTSSRLRRSSRLTPGSTMCRRHPSSTSHSTPTMCCDGRYPRPTTPCSRQCALWSTVSVKVRRSTSRTPIQLSPSPVSRVINCLTTRATGNMP